MLTIDGSHLEGGGQILRLAVALSAISETPVTITRIRQNRKNPGLAPQHIAAVRAVAGMCDAECRGLTPGNSEITFIPAKIRRADLVIDLATAGSIPLILQAWLPAALHSGGSITVLGGTEVPWSPTIDYMNFVFAPILRNAGATIDIDVLERGYYPRGRGRVHVRVEPSQLDPIVIPEGEHECGIISCSAGLPRHVVERQAKAAREQIESDLNLSCTTTLDPREGKGGVGSSITVWSGAKGAVALGKRGLPAEEVGRTAARSLIHECRSPGAVDIFLADQLLVYLALYGGECSTHTLSMHAKTACWLLSEFGYHLTCRENDIVEIAA
ncbi:MULTISPECIES: RNA 3'-terminal phosphate cyclase [Methanoculleus]|jgi:RNA 3'-terminal phosphate cyclase (ATP)|uniref:RNA 3'-terminal phosphate cyclase n=1 Tax=Methanoculleus thermophilus TaxID=2200 RepID=A0A1G9BG31_9EURY|nr:MULTISPECIES: RNA 3'-terminal phosphate cyclase [Methanoculleus]NLN08191.1 RNA 3'-terminal phosphate cyclase [Methanoculleus thermophilus]SDK37815.1 RNA 3'-terminal phosphate cyclase (ATP) [Methanoculleus thermophilus]HQD25642.1 RNA 3'-terminal phosphate cyclase [Methanoculleus thermophilus]